MSFLLANGNFQLPGGGPVANGVLTLTLSNPSATVIATGGAATAVYTFTLDANGNLPAGSTVLGNSELTPAGTFYTASLVTSGGTSVPLANNVWVVGPSAPYAGSLFPDVSVYPPLSISGTVSGALSITGNSGLPAASTVNLYMAGNFGSPILGKIYVGDGTGWELDFAKRVGSVDTTLAKITDKGQVLATGVAASGIGAFACAPNSLIDGGNGTLGQGGYVVFTADASATAGYSAWSTNNAYWNGTSWIQPRGAGTSSHGLAVSHHKDFSFNFAAAGGTNNAAITWTEWANLNVGGFNLKTGNYFINGVQISASNLSNGVTGSGTVVLATSPTLTTPNIGAATGTSVTVSGVVTSTAATGFTIGAISNAPRITYTNTNAGFEYEFLTGTNAIAGVQIASVDTFETAGPGTSAAGHARLWADSTSHFWKANNNAGTSYNLIGDTTTQTVTNKRVTPRAVAVADATSITPNSDTSDVVTQTNTQVAGTLTIANPTGTPTDGQKLIIRIKTANAQTYSFGTSYAFSTSVTAPTTIAAGKTDYLGCIWNATNSKWDVVAVDQGH